MTPNKTRRHPPVTWPPPRWPGCPGTIRYRNAIKQASAHPCHTQPSPKDRSNPSPSQRRTKSDARIIMDLTEAHTDYTNYINHTNANIQDFDLANIVLLVDDLSNDRVIPYAIIQRDQDPSYIAIAFCSRDPHWMGVSHHLPQLAGTHALVYTYDGVNPHAIIAVQESNAAIGIDTLPSVIDPLIPLATRDGRCLDRILTFHGATPHYFRIDPSQYHDLIDTLAPAVTEPPDTRCDHDGPCLPLLHNGDPWDWRN